MKVKATIGFAGLVCMAPGEIREIPEEDAAPLLDCGYVEALEVAAATAEIKSAPESKDPPEDPSKETTETPEENKETEERAEEAHDTESAEDAHDEEEPAQSYLDVDQLKKMKRTDLNDLAVKMGVQNAVEYPNVAALAEAVSKIPVIPGTEEN